MEKGAGYPPSKGDEENQRSNNGTAPKAKQSTYLAQRMETFNKQHLQTTPRKNNKVSQMVEAMERAASSKAAEKKDVSSKPAAAKLVPTLKNSITKNTSTNYTIARTAITYQRSSPSPTILKSKGVGSRYAQALQRQQAAKNTRGGGSQSSTTPVQPLVTVNDTETKNVELLVESNNTAATIEPLPVLNVSEAPEEPLPVEKPSLTEVVSTEDEVIPTEPDLVSTEPDITAENNSGNDAASLEIARIMTVLQSPTTLKQLQAGKSIDQLLQAAEAQEASIAQPTPFSSFKAWSQAFTGDSTNCKSEHDEHTVTTTSSFETKVLVDGMSRMAQSLYEISGQVSNDVQEAAKTFLSMEDIHKIQPGFKYKLLKMIRDQVVQEAILKAQTRFPITADDEIVTIKRVILSGDLLMGEDVMEITVLHGKVKHLMLAKESLPSQWTELPQEDSCEELPVEPVEPVVVDEPVPPPVVHPIQPESMELTEQEKAVLRLAPKAVYETSSEEETGSGSPDVSFAEVTHGITSIEKLLTLPAVEKELRKDVAKLMQREPKCVPKQASQKLDESSDESTCNLDWTREESLFAPTADWMHEEDTSITRDWTRDGTFLADDEATFEQEETYDEFSQDDSFLISIPAKYPNDTRSEEVNARQSDRPTRDETVLDDSTQHSSNDLSITKVPEASVDEEEVEEVDLTDDGQETRSEHPIKEQELNSPPLIERFRNERNDDASYTSGSTVVTTNGGDSKLQTTFCAENSTPMSVLQMNYSPATTLNSTLPSVALFNDGDTLNDPSLSLLIGDTINMDATREETEPVDMHACALPGYSAALGCRPTQSSLEEIKSTLGFDQESDSGSFKSTKPVPVSEAPQVSLDKEAITESESSRLEQAATHTVLDRSIVDEVQGATSTDQVAHQEQAVTTCVDVTEELEEGGRLWKLIVTKTEAEARRQEARLVRGRSAHAPAKTQPSTEELHSYVTDTDADDSYQASVDVTAWTERTADNTFVEDIRLGRFAPKKLLRHMSCGDQEDSVLCADMAPVLSTNKKKPQQVVVPTPSSSSDRKVSVALNKKTKKTLHSKQIAKQQLIRARSDSTRGSNAEPVDAASYITEMMGQELVQVVSDFITACDEFSRSTEKLTNGEPTGTTSCMRCW